MLGARQNGLDGSVPLQQDSNPFGQLGSLPYTPAQNPVQSAFAAQPPQHQSEFPPSPSCNDVICLMLGAAFGCSCTRLVKHDLLHSIIRRLCS